MPDSSPAVAKAAVFANGLRKNVAASGRRWSAWPRGAAQLAAVVAAIDAAQQRLAAAPDDAAAAAGVGELRAILEWSVYQNAALAAARSLRVARRTRALTHDLHLLADDADPVRLLVDAEESLIDVVRTRNAYMDGLARRFPQLGLPAPLVAADVLAAPATQPSGRLALIQSLKRIATTDGGRGRSPLAKRARRVGRVIRPR